MTSDLPDAISHLTDRSSQLIDVAVIGGGAAGLNAALMLGRSRRTVVVIDAGSPRNAPAAGVHGLLGHEGIPPTELLARGRSEVTSYGGQVIEDTVRAAHPAPAVAGDLRFTIELGAGRVITARRIIVATGTRDDLPAIPGLAEHWGHGLVHCPYCHGWEVRDRAIAVIATGPHAAHQAMLFRQLSDDVILLSQGVSLDPEAQRRLTARGVTIREETVAEVLATDQPDPDTGSRVAGVRLASGEVIEREVLAIGSTVRARLDGLAGLGLSVEDLPGGIGDRVPVEMAGVTAVPGVWAAGNVAEPMAQVGASAAAGALAGAHVNMDLAIADADAAS